jgi:hypothetical protein
MRREAELLAVRIGAALLAGLAMLALTGTAHAQPAGNNGTVKIHSDSTDSEPTIRNEPHVATFHLHFQFADPSQAGGWEVRTWAPGDSGDVVLAGRYDTAGDGADRQPAVGTFTLPDGHYKLFWTGRTEDNVKHKTFWVENVAAPTAVTSPSASPTGEELPITGSPPAAITPPPTDLPAGAAGDAQVGGAVVVAVMTLAVSAWLAFTALGGGGGSSRG